MSLYNKYRPPGFDQIIGNQNTVNYLKTATQDHKTCPHVFLLSGPTGCGKTTLARIIANDLGCSTDDLREMNTADFRGIDSVRDIIRSSKYYAMRGAVRVWIIDEVHKMTNDAQNAILKLLEDSPDHAYFILCTTDPNKLLATMKNRCIQLEVKPLNDKQMFGLLRSISKAEGTKLKRVVCEQIIQDSFGLPRNAIQILEKVLGVSSKQQLEMASQSANEYSESIELCRALIKQSSWDNVREILKQMKDQDAESVRRHVLGYSQSVLLNGENNKAAFILEEFCDPFYDSGFPKLVLACYTVIKG